MKREGESSIGTKRAKNGARSESYHDWDSIANWEMMGKGKYSVSSFCLFACRIDQWNRAWNCETDSYLRQPQKSLTNLHRDDRKFALPRRDEKWVRRRGKRRGFGSLEIVRNEEGRERDQIEWEMEGQRNGLCISTVYIGSATKTVSRKWKRCSKTEIVRSLDLSRAGGRGQL